VKYNFFEFRSMRLKISVLFFFMIAGCVSYGQNKEGRTFQPKLDDYRVGEKWSWRYKGITNAGEIRSEGVDTRKIINHNGNLVILIGSDTVLVEDLVKPTDSKTPKYDWPLEVGKKWKYEQSWTSQDGTTGKQSQNVSILSFKEETVEAGSFMAYTIQYKGRITNSRGYEAPVEEIWWYAPEVKNFIKLTQKQDDFLYVEELIEYFKPD
jgi:hypothetical protein